MIVAGTQSTPQSSTNKWKMSEHRRGSGGFVHERQDILVLLSRLFHGHLRDDPVKFPATPPRLQVDAQGVVF